MFDPLPGTRKHSFEVEDEIENQTLNCKISSDHQIQTSIGHLRPGWTFEPRPKTSKAI